MKRSLLFTICGAGLLAAVAACSSGSSPGTDGGAGAAGQRDGGGGAGGSAAGTGGTGGSVGGSAGTAGTTDGGAGTDGSVGGSAGAGGLGGVGGSVGGSAGSGGAGGLGGAGGSGGDMSLHGIVVDRLLRPVAGMPVVVGQDAIVTNDDGTFVLETVSDKYDAMVVDTNNNVAYVFKDLARRDPTLQLIGYLPTPATLALSGNITGNNIPNPSGSTVTTVFGSPTGACQQSAWTAVGNPSYSSAIELHGGTSVDGKVYSMQWTVDSSPDQLPVSYTGYGNAPVSSGDAGGALTQDVALVALAAGATVDFTGTITPPAGYAVDARYIGVNFDDYTVMHTVLDTSEATGTTDFSYKTPKITGAHATFMVDAETDDEETAVITPGLALDATGVDVTVPNAPVLALPVDNAMGVSTSTTFLWSEMAGSVYFVTFRPNSGGPWVFLMTSHSSVTLPDLSSVGLAYGSNAPYEWWITALAPFASTDAACGPDGYQAAFNYTDSIFEAAVPIPPFPPLTTATTIGWSNARGFNTAP